MSVRVCSPRIRPGPGGKNDGHHEKHVGKHLVAAGEDLAAALAQDRDEDTDRIRVARAEIARIRGA